MAQAVINYNAPPLAEALGSGLMYKRELAPLRPEIEHLRFSPDGKYILVQDSSTITILNREPLSVAFRVDVEDAEPATFSPDSKEFVVSNVNLRIQRYNIAEKALVTTSELALKGGYWQTKISPDGRYAAVFRYNSDLVVYDVASNEEIFKEKDFYLPTRFEVFLWQFQRAIFGTSEVGALRIQFSPDSRYVLAGRKGQGLLVNAYGMGGARRQTLAVDLTTRKPLKLDETIKKLLIGSMDFLTADKVIGIMGGEISKAGVFSFPTGERLDQFELGGLLFTPAHSGDYVAVRPVKGAAVGIYDLKQKKYVLGNRKSAIDIYGDHYVVEQRNGEVSILSLSTKQMVSSVQLPPSPLSRVRALSMSPGGKWLTFSEKSRGAVWNLATNERVHHVRAFDGSFTNSNGQVFADFPKSEEQARTIAMMSPTDGKVTPLPHPIGEGNATQIGPYMLTRKSTSAKEREEEKKAEAKAESKAIFSNAERPKSVAYEETTFELRNVETGASLWTRKFADQTPWVFSNASENTMGFYWRADSEAAKAIIDANPGLTEKFGSLKNRSDDLLIQTIDPPTGVVNSTVLLETGEGSIEIDSITSSGDFLVVNDNDNRILVYSLASGKLLYRFFGSYAVLSSESGKIAIENSPGRVTVYDLKSGSEVERLTFATDVSAMRFVDRGKILFVLSANQMAYIFTVSKMGMLVSQLRNTAESVDLGRNGF